MAVSPRQGWLSKHLLLGRIVPQIVWIVLIAVWASSADGMWSTENRPSGSAATFRDAPDYK